MTSPIKITWRKGRRTEGLIWSLNPGGGGSLTSHAEITGQGQLQAPSQGHAVHGRDGGHGQQSCQGITTEGKKPLQLHHGGAILQQRDGSKSYRCGS